MPISSVIALITAVVLGFLSLNTDDAFTIFFAIVAVISLVISLILVSWVVKLVILIGGLGAMRYYCYRHACDREDWKR